MTDLLLASNIPGKVKQLRQILPDDVQIVTMADLGLPEPLEDGETFAANASMRSAMARCGWGKLAM